MVGELVAVCAVRFRRISFGEHVVCSTANRPIPRIVSRRSSVDVFRANTRRVVAMVVDLLAFRNWTEMDHVRHARRAILFTT